MSSEHNFTKLLRKWLSNAGLSLQATNSLINNGYIEKDLFWYCTDKDIEQIANECNIKTLDKLKLKSAINGGKNSNNQRTLSPAHRSNNYNSSAINCNSMIIDSDNHNNQQSRHNFPVKHDNMKPDIPMNMNKNKQNSLSRKKNKHLIRNNIKLKPKTSKIQKQKNEISNKKRTFEESISSNCKEPQQKKMKLMNCNQNSNSSVSNKKCAMEIKNNSKYNQIIHKAYKNSNINIQSHKNKLKTDLNYHFAVHCHFCNQHFLDYDKYTKHLKAHYDNDATKTWLKCEYFECKNKKLFRCISQFISHISTKHNKNTNDKPFKCDFLICGLSYGTKSSLKNHWNKIHIHKKIKNNTQCKDDKMMDQKFKSKLKDTPKKFSVDDYGSNDIEMKTCTKRKIVNECVNRYNNKVSNTNITPSNGYFNHISNRLKTNCNFQRINFQQIKANGAPYNCPCCNIKSFIEWYDWKVHWHKLHHRNYVDVERKMIELNNVNNRNNNNNNRNRMINSNNNLIAQHCDGEKETETINSHLKDLLFR